MFVFIFKLLSPLCSHSRSYHAHVPATGTNLDMVTDTGTDMDMGTDRDVDMGMAMDTDTDMDNVITHKIMNIFWPRYFLSIWISVKRSYQCLA